MKTPALLTAAVLALTALAATPDGAGAEPLAAAAPELLAGLQASLLAQHGWLNAVLSWMGAFRVIGKFIGGFLQTQVENLLAKAVASHDPEIRAWVERLLAGRPYRVTAFVVDFLFSVKFPAKLPPSP